MSGELSISKFDFNRKSLDVIVVNNGDDENKSYFFGSKVACVLGYKKPRNAILKFCPNRINFSEFSEARAPNSSYYCPHTVFITESDVYRLVMRSKTQDAVNFQDFVCDELLPSIRKFGSYPPPSANTQSSKKMIGYDLGDHNDRMKYNSEIGCCEDSGYRGDLSTIGFQHKCVNNELRKQTKASIK